MEKTIRKLSRNSQHQKYYLANGDQVIGASTISKLGQNADPLIAWAHKLGLQGVDYKKVRDDAGDAGTVAHFMIETYLLGEEHDLSEFDKEAIDKATNVFLKFLDWWDSQGLAFVSAETQLVSERHRYGGTLDILCRDHNDGLVLLDTKSSNGIWDNFFYQLAGYENLANENYDENITRRAIIRFGKKEHQGDMEIKWLPDITKYLNVFIAQVQLHHAMNQIPKQRYYKKKQHHGFH